MPLLCRREWADLSGKLQGDFSIGRYTTEVNTKLRDDARALWDKLTKAADDKGGKGKGKGKGDKGSSSSGSLCALCVNRYVCLCVCRRQGCPMAEW